MATRCRPDSGIRGRLGLGSHQRPLAFLDLSFLEAFSNNFCEDRRAVSAETLGRSCVYS